MKPTASSRASRLVPLALCLAPILALLAGCVSHNLPKDSYMQGVVSKIVTPWGTGEMQIDMAATGTAAKNVTLPDPPPAKTTGKTPK